VSRAPDPDVSVRPATPDDLETVLAFRLALLREHAGNPMYGRLREDAPERARKLFAGQLAAVGEVTYLAEIGDAAATAAASPPSPARRRATVRRPVGILRCIESRGSPLLDPPKYGYVASVYVVPEARRMGVAQRLLDAAVRWCDERGLDEIRLHTASDNVDGNAAGEAMGFQTVEVLRIKRIAS
jgi:ribosomal protein S18 acetylase RimI-like enzyme